MPFNFPVLYDPGISSHLFPLKYFCDQSLTPQEVHNGLDFSTEGEDGEFSIFSVKFSNDGREIVAAAGDGAIYVYDLLENKPTLRIPAHSVIHCNPVMLDWHFIGWCLIIFWPLYYISDMHNFIQLVNLLSFF